MTAYSPEMITAVVAFVLPFLLDVVPGLKDWFGKLSKAHKQWFMLVLMVVVGVSIPVLGCRLNLIDLMCADVTSELVIKTVGTALVASVTGHKSTKYIPNGS